MKRQTLGWAFAFVGFSALASILASSCLRNSGSPTTIPTIQKRDPASVSEIELELVLHKIREGDLRQLKNDLEGARRSWEEARKLGQGLWPIHEGLGDSLARARLYEESAREYEHALPLVPGSQTRMREEISFKRGEVLAEAGHPLEAIQSYLEANHPRELAAKVLSQAKKVGNVTAVEKVLSDRASIIDPRVYALLSAFYTYWDRTREAAEATAHYAIGVAPWDEALNRQTVERLVEAKEIDLAMDVCRAWVRATPQDVRVYRLMGDILLGAGRQREAILAYTSIVDVKPGDPAAHRLLGDIFKGMNRFPDAIRQYEAAKIARPEDKDLYPILMSLYEGRGDLAQAEATLLEGTRRFGTMGDIGSHLISLYKDKLKQVETEGKRDEALMLRRKLGELNCFEEGVFDLRITMTWDAKSDVDLDVFEPGGEHVDHGHPHSKPGGHYYYDNTHGFGPETYSLPKAPPGTYRIGAHLHGNVRSTVKFVVVLFEGTPAEERREECLVLTQGNGISYIGDIVIPQR